MPYYVSIAVNFLNAIYFALISLTVAWVSEFKYLHQLSVNDDRKWKSDVMFLKWIQYIARVNIGH